MKRQEFRDGELTPPNRFEIDYFEAVGPVKQFVTTFYHFHCEDPLVRDIQPAALGDLALFPCGKGRMRLPDGKYDHSHDVTLLTPFSRAMPFEVEGPFHAIGAALSPLGWAALTGMHAQEHANRLYDAAERLPADIAESGVRLCARYRDGSASAVDLAAELSFLIVKHAKLPRRRHVELIAAVVRWLSGSLLPDMEDLYAASTFSQRQTQRLVQQYFGVSPVALRRKYRALRAASMLSRPGLSPTEEAALAEAFYDQSHMIHELREFVGRTPSRLVDGRLPHLAELIAQKNLRELGL